MLVNVSFDILLLIKHLICNSSGSVVAGVVFSGSVSVGLVSSGSVVAGVVFSGSVSVGFVSSGSVVASVLFSGSVVAGVLFSGSVVAGVLSSGSVFAGVLSSGSVFAGVDSLEGSSVVVAVSRYCTFEISVGPAHILPLLGTHMRVSVLHKDLPIRSGIRLLSLGFRSKHAKRHNRRYHQRIDQLA
ncbi:hypothetical protein FF38_10369 [Lucilia cuprina]|uniref:Uncharacterized protein n=1 Tax=Lucilia cuprina TaxID=7375 RepID=A0A0L0C0E0_LUCCU|nr:hypothetical protein FF38_10369 [Lucilia cuprina]